MVREIKLASFHYLKLNGERKENFDGELRIAPNINIKSIDKFDSDKKQDVVKIVFSFEVDYGELGKINLEGFMLLIVDSKTLKDVVDGWKAKKLDNEINLTIINVIMQKASIKAIQLEDELGLPSHIQIPRLQLGKKE